MTRTLHKILVCVDGSDKSLEAADYSISIAQNSRAQLVILNVIETEPWLYGEKAYEWGSPEKLDEAYANKKVEIQKILDQIKKNAEAVGIQSNSEILLAPRTQGAVKAILEYVEQLWEREEILESRKSCLAVSQTGCLPSLIVPSWLLSKQLTLVRPLSHPLQ